MKISEPFISAIRSLSANKLRSFLTMLGMIIGVFSVVTLIALVNGVENFIIDSFNALGSNLILVSPGNIDMGSDPALAYANNKLDEKHMDLIDKHASDYVDNMTPNIRMNKLVTRRSNSFYGSIYGASDQAIKIVDLGLEKGRFFTQAEVREKKKVAVIAPEIVKELFGELDPIGQEVKVDDMAFVVIGTTKSKGRMSDDRVIIPYTSVMEYFNVKNLSGITIKAKDNVDLDEARKQVKYAIRRDLKDDEFTVFTQKDILKSVSQILGVLSSALAAISGISLIVGGIGIMNIMLVSVTERTQEIGLKKALGATSNNIALQFSIEALLIGLLGGMLGLSLAFVVTFLARSFIRATIPLWGILLSFIFSLVVGLLFGTYPAITAAKKDPIVALGYE
ncbi:MAG: ABC transporter permease [Patescibacteria group bacterium]|jgi:putative ABC transport system permease protein